LPWINYQIKLDFAESVARILNVETVHGTLPGGAVAVAGQAIELGNVQVGVLQHDGTHHFVVLMREDVAVVDVAGVLGEVGLGDGEVGVGLHGGVTICVGSPTHADHKQVVGVNEGSVLPPLLMRLKRSICGVLAQVLVSEAERTPSLRISCLPVGQLHNVHSGSDSVGGDFGDVF
jgi:hypothetical protein